MTENYNYPDTHEMLELHDILEELLSKGEYTMRLGEGSKIYADSSLDFLLAGTFYVQCSARCAFYRFGEAKIISNEHILEDIQNGNLPKPFCR